MPETAYERIISALRQHGSKVIERGDRRAEAQCPAHDDGNPSLGVRGIEGQALIYCQGGCDHRDVLACLDMTPADMYDERSAEYRYDDGRTVRRFYDETGKKRFAQTGAGETSTLFHLAALNEAALDRYVFLVEGEKDVLALESAGGIATTAPQGSGSFHKADVTPLASRWVTVVVDRDPAGDKWASQVADKLDGVARRYRFVQSAAGKDAADHVAAGYGLTDFVQYELPDDAAEQPDRSAFAQTIMRRSHLGNLPKVEPLIEGVLSLRSTIILLGPSGAGKTFVSLAWACAVGTGTAWLGHAVTRAGALYVVGEGASGLHDRITAYEQAWKAPVSDDDVMFSIRPDTLSSAATWREMADEARDLRRRVVFLDTFSSLAPDADETKDAAILTRRMANLSAAIDGTVVLVHHPGWGDATRARGGSQLEANVDEVLVLHGDRNDPKIALEVKKRKEGYAGAKTWLRRNAAYGSVVIERLPEAEWLKDIGNRAAEVLREVHGDDPVSMSTMNETLRTKMKIEKTQATERITELRKAGMVKLAVKGGGKDGKYNAKYVISVGE